MRKSAPILATIFLMGCHPTPPLLPNGCYYTDEGTPLLRVSGQQGQVLIPGDVGKVELMEGRFWGGPHVSVKPGFYVQSPELRAVADRPLRWVPFSVRPSPAGSVILVPMEAAGEEEIRLGPPCAAAK